MKPKAKPPTTAILQARLDGCHARVKDLEIEIERLNKMLNKYTTCVVCECTLEPSEIVPHCENCVPEWGINYDVEGDQYAD